MLLGSHVPHDKLRAIFGPLGSITGKQYADAMSNLLDLAGQLFVFYMDVQIDPRREWFTNAVNMNR